LHDEHAVYNGGTAAFEEGVLTVRLTAGFTYFEITNNSFSPESLYHLAFQGK